MSSAKSFDSSRLTSSAGTSLNWRNDDMVDHCARREEGWIECEVGHGCHSMTLYALAEVDGQVVLIGRFTSDPTGIVSDERAAQIEATMAAWRAELTVTLAGTFAHR